MNSTVHHTNDACGHKSRPQHLKIIFSIKNPCFISNKGKTESVRSNKKKKATISHEM